MSSLLNQLNVFENIPKYLKKSIKCYHVFGVNKSLLFVTIDDKVYGLGYNGNGRLGFGHQSCVETPTELTELRNKRIKEFFIATNFVLALTSDEKIYSWGQNRYGQLARGFVSEQGECLKPKLVNGFGDNKQKVRQISCGYDYALVLLENGELFAWGWNEYGFLGENLDYITKPERMKSLIGFNVKSFFSNGECCFLINTDNEVYSWGYDEQSDLAHDGYHNCLPNLIEDLSNLNVISIISKLHETYFLTSDGKLYFCDESKENALYQNKRCLPLTKIESDNEYDKLKLICLNICVFDKNKGIVNELIRNELIETEFKSFEEYSVTKFEQTYRTFNVRMEYEYFSPNKLIGHGTFGKVFKVNFYGEDFAVKKVLIDNMHKELLDRNSEWEILKQLKSEFVVELFENWIEGEFLFIRMELCDQDLKEIIETKKNNNLKPTIDYLISCEIFRQLVESINYLHSRSPPIIHRDLKPSNVLVKYHNEHAQLKLCDFGLSKVMESDIQTNTSQLGTFKYRAPEVSGNKYNEKIDIFSLGIIVQELFEQCFSSQVISQDTNWFDFFIFNIFSRKVTLPKLANRVKTLKKIKSDMIHGESGLRPSCEEILGKIHTWQFNKQELHSSSVFENALDNQNGHFGFFKFLNNLK